MHHTLSAGGTETLMERRIAFLVTALRVPFASKHQSRVASKHAFPQTLTPPCGVSDKKVTIRGLREERDNADADRVRNWRGEVV